MTLPSSPEPKDLIDEWKANPDQEVWVVDETKTPLSTAHKSQGHGELIAFSIVRLRAKDATELLDQTALARTRLAPQDATASFKSGRLYGAYETSLRRGRSDGPLLAFVGIIAECLGHRQHIMQLLTTHLHVRGTPETKLTAVLPNGDVKANTSKQLNVVNNALRRLIDEWKPARGPVDVVIDRAAALGLSPGQQGIQPHQFNMMRGPLKPGDSIEVRIIAGSDTEPTLRDLLLLPDFFGYLTRMHQQAGHSPNLDAAIEQVLSGQTPFLLAPFDLAAMISAAKQAAATASAATEDKTT